MADTPAIATPLPPNGRIKVVGKAHGALNCVVTPADNPADWYFKQFISQEEFDAYVLKYRLIIEGNNDASDPN